MSNFREDFYLAFQNEFRGTEEVIQNRLRVYLPILEINVTVENQGEILALDLGSGRGEWLSLLKQFGAKAVGVDSDIGMVQTSRSNGLDVIHGDALQFMRNARSASFDIVTSFHLIEHLTFDGYFSLIQEAYRILKPGGVLILETPNPENPLVGISGIWSDPTHLAPIPSSLLSFLCSFIGFSQIDLLFLQESTDLLESKDISLFQVFVSPSPDYGLIAKKDEAAPKKVISFLNEGLSLQSLADRYDANLQSHLEAIRKEYEGFRQKQDEFLDSKLWRSYLFLSKFKFLVKNKFFTSRLRNNT